MVREIACDVQLGDHPAQFGMDAKYAAMKTSKANPFIDTRTCRHETDIQEAMFKAVLAEQQQKK